MAAVPELMSGTSEINAVCIVYELKKILLLGNEQRICSPCNKSEHKNIRSSVGRAEASSSLNAQVRVLSGVIMASDGSFNNIPKLIRAMPRIIDKATERSGVYYAGRVIDRIVDQDPTWLPKSPATLESEGEDKTKLWVNKGDLFNEIHQERPKDSKKGEYAVNVGVFSEDRIQAALSLEFGAPDARFPIPARPLFAPVFDENIDRIVKMQEKTINQEINKHLE